MSSPSKTSGPTPIQKMSQDSNSLLRYPTDDDDYITRALKSREILPPVTWRNWHKNIHWPHFLIFLLSGGLTLLGPVFVRWNWKTILFCIVYLYLFAFGITAGYHRLWSHNSYNGSKPLQYLLAILGAGAGQHDIEWWCARHRAHHRYTDTALDPYNTQISFFWSHFGWILFKPRCDFGFVDISDLRKNPVVQWQKRNYALLIVVMYFIIPVAIPWYFWGESLSACVVWGIGVRSFLLYNMTFSVNSLAHWLGEAPFDDKHTGRDHFLTALLTLGEGYHNFHHQFPMDYRSAIKWYQYDPTKWFIWTCHKLGLASCLKVFPENEIRKSELTMQLKTLRERQDSLSWPRNDLPVVDWETFQQQSTERPLILIAGFIHDISDFIDDHPGGADLLLGKVGKDATTAFFGGFYNHSNAAHNLLSMKRVGALRGGVESGLDEKHISPSLRLRIIRYNEHTYSP